MRASIGATLTGETKRLFDKVSPDMIPLRQFFLIAAHEQKSGIILELLKRHKTIKDLEEKQLMLIFVSKMDIDELMAKAMSLDTTEDSYAHVLEFLEESKTVQT